MNLLNKIKQLLTYGQEEKDTTVNEMITLEELPCRLESKINELTKLKKQLRELISKKTSLFETEINEKIISLGNIDISHRKEYDRIKIIVKENLNLYISHLKRTIDNLKDIEKEELEEYKNKIFSVLNCRFNY